MNKKKTKPKGYAEEIEIPEGVEVKIDGSKIIIKKGETVNERDFNTKKIKFVVQDNKIKFTAPRSTKRERKLAGSIMAHVKNLMKGASGNHIYKLKICSGHFPMNASVSGNEFVIKNFLGESVPRKLKLKEGVSVKINGNEVVVESKSKELAGQTAASIEILTRITNRDLTRFQDG
ncbi:50S ribosomal protein L6, partial [Candidatus Woesearchaeota archaeon]|nr:50S ribosomal protein L6 [Candidatus Woesearchaeota archaeon]